MNIYECGQKETIFQYFSRNIYKQQQDILFRKIGDVLPKFRKLSRKYNDSVLLYGYNLSNEEFDCRNISISFAVQTYITSTK